MPKEVSSDVRFGASFLDVKYAKQAVNGEVLSDKQDAELYLKRPSDGRVVAYNEKVASIYQIIQEYNIDYQAMVGFKYPIDPGALFVISRFKTNFLSDLEKRDVDITKQNLVFPSRSLAGTNFACKLSVKTNGLFAKIVSRHVDRNLIGYLMSVFNNYTSGAVPPDKLGFGEWLAANPDYGVDTSANFAALTNWSTSNAIIYYEVKVVGLDSDNSERTNVTSSAMCIRLNEQSFVSLPPGYASGFSEITSITFTMKKIIFPKLQYAYYLANIEENREQLKGFIEDDLMLVVRDSALYYFIDNAADRVTESDYSSTYFCVDYLYLDDAIGKIMVNSGGGVYAQSERPDPGLWIVDSMWSEEIRRVYAGNSVVEYETENSINSLQKYIYVKTSIDTEFTQNRLNPTGLYLMPVI